MIAEISPWDIELSSGTVDNEKIVLATVKGVEIGRLQIIPGEADDHSYAFALYLMAICRGEIRPCQPCYWYWNEFEEITLDMLRYDSNGVAFPRVRPKAEVSPFFRLFKPKEGDDEIQKS